MKEGWEMTKLKEVCIITSGQSAPQGDEKYSLVGTPFVKAGNLLDLTNGVSENDIQQVKDDVATAHKLTLFPKGSVVFAKSGMSCLKGYIYTLKQNCYVVSHLAVLIPNDKIISPYLNYVLKLYKPSSLAADAAFPSVKLSELGLFSIPVPSLSEQQRIVDILDAEFAKIDALKENAEKQLQQTKALLRQQQNVTFTKQQSVPLQSMVEIINGYAFKSEDFDKSHTVKAIKITNVGVGTFVETDDTNLACCHLHDQKDFIAHSGDIVIALTRTIISDGLKVAIVPNSYNQALLNQRVALLRINDDILREYLYYYFQTTEVKKYVLGRVNELMQPNLSIKDLRAMPIPCCEREEMHKCVTNLKYFDELCNTLKSNYMKTIHLCNDLKQALLRKAFNGEL